MKKHLTRNLRCLGFVMERRWRSFHAHADVHESPAEPVLYV